MSRRLDTARDRVEPEISTDEVDGSNRGIAAQIQPIIERCVRCGPRCAKFGGDRCDPRCIECGYSADCVNCGAKIPVKRLKRAKGVAKYCSPECERAYHRALYYQNNGGGFADIPTGTVGAINELRVCVDLLAKGHHVFRALSPACPCDLIILVDRRVYRIEVTTGHRSRNGRIQYARHNSADFDLLAVVLADRIVYFTEVPELQSLVSPADEGKP